MDDPGEHAANRISQPGIDEREISSSILINDQHQHTSISGCKRKSHTDGNTSNAPAKRDHFSVDSDSKELCNTSIENTNSKGKTANTADTAAQPPKPNDGSRESQGVKNFLVGISYQQKLTIVILCYAAIQMKDEEQFDFTITSEDPEGGKFDDITVRFIVGGRLIKLFIQAKHKEVQKETITWAKLKSVDKHASFSVSKYINSFMEQGWDTDKEPPILALCTTIGLAEDVRNSTLPYEYEPRESIVKSIFQSITNEVYNIDIDMLDDDSRNSLFEHLIENSELVCLAKQLAKHIFDESMLDFRNVLFQKYRYAIETQIATNERVKKKGDYFKVNEQFTDSEFKIILEEEYERLYKGKDFWKDIRKKGIGIRKAQNAEPCNLPDTKKLPKKIENRHIQKFFKSFILVVRTKHEEDIQQVISSMIENYSFKLLPGEIQGPVPPSLVSSHVSDWTLKWMKQKNNEPLKMQNVEDMFKQLVSPFHLLNFQGASKMYCKVLESSGLMLKREKLVASKLYHEIEPLSKTPSENILYRCSYHPSIVWQVLQLFKGKLNYMFIEGTYYNLLRDQLMKALGTTNIPLILFIDCIKNANDDQNYIHQVPPCCKKIMLYNQPFKSTEVSENFLFGDLIKDESMDAQLNENACFFGTTLSFRTLMRDEDSLSFWLDVRNCDDGAQMKQNINKDNFEKIRSTYIERQWLVCNETSKRGTSSFYFWEQRHNMYRWDERLITAYRSEEMMIREFLETNWKFPMSNASWGTPQARIPPPGVESNEISPEDATKVHIFLNEAGSGKTFYLSWLAADLQTAHPSWWVIKLNLIEYATDFRRLMRPEGYEKIDALMALKTLFQLIYLAIYVPAVNRRTTEETDKHREKAQACVNMLGFSDGHNDFIKLIQDQPNLTSEQLVLLRIFQNKFNCKELVVLLDGFDEISPHYKEVALDLITWFERFKGVRKLYLTSRPYDFRPEFKSYVEHCQFNLLKNLTEHDILSYMYRMLSCRFEGFESLKENMQNDLVLIFFHLSTSYLGEISEIPLFLSMVLEHLLPIVKECVDLKLGTISLKIIKKCDQIFEPLRMMENFVDRKLNITNTEKSGATDASGNTPAALGAAGRENKRNNRIHSLLALHVLMDEKDRLSLLTPEEQKKARQYMQEVNQGEVKSGIVEGAVDNVPIFIHRLFAEYFAARWFYDHQECDGVKDFLKRNVYDNNTKEEIKRFIDRMVCSKNELHLAVLENSKVNVENLLKKNPTLVHAQDSWGRIPLHLVLSYVSERNYDIFTLLLHRTDNSRVNLKDLYFGWNPMNYALYWDDRCHWRYCFVLDFLERGGAIQTDEYLTITNCKDPIEMLINVISFEHHVSRRCTEYGTSLPRTHLKLLFKDRKIAEMLTTKRQLNLHCAIPSVKVHTFLPIFNEENIAPYIKNAGSFTPLELCIIFDSILTEDLVKCASQIEIMPSDGGRFATLACRTRSLSAFHYFHVERQYSVLVSNFEKTLMKALFGIFVPSAFDSFYREYCSDFGIVCHEDLPQLGQHLDYYNFEARCQNEMLRYFPKSFVRTEWGIDSGTEFLLATALKVDKIEIVEYLVKSSRMAPLKSFFINLLKQYNIDSHFNHTHYYLIERIYDLYKDDEKGRNLLHTAVEQGMLNFVKLLCFRYKFDVMKSNPRENNWNALFYCVVNGENENERFEIFKFLMDQQTVDCNKIIDSKKISLIDYAKRNNDSIARHIAVRYSETRYTNPNLGEKTTFDYSHEYRVFNSTDEEGRSALHNAIRMGNSKQVEYLMNQLNVDFKQPDAMENNWNGFFYCVSEYDEVTCVEKLNIFTYMMEIDPFDCFAEVDSKGKCVFYYATKNNDKIAKYIFRRECSLMKHLSTKEQVFTLMGHLDKSFFEVTRRLKYLHENDLLSDIFIEYVCEYLKNYEQLNYIDNETGQNLLNIAIEEGWTDMAKVLINRYNFDPKAINKKENNCKVPEMSYLLDRIKIYFSKYHKNMFDNLLNQGSRNYGPLPLGEMGPNDTVIPPNGPR